jgi:hypothetical protein
MVLLAPLFGHVNRSAAFELLPIVHPQTQDGKKIYLQSGKFRKVPFYGEDGILITVRYDGIERGVRRGGKHMRHVVSLDLQCAEKNIHVFLSEDNIHLSGVLDTEMGMQAFTYVCDFLNMVQQNLEYFHSVSAEVRERTMEWVTEVTATDLMLMERSGEEKGIACRGFDDSTLEEIPSDVDERIAAFLLCYANEFDLHQDFVQKMEKISHLKSLCSSKIRVGNFRIVNTIYNYKIQINTSMIDLTHFLIGQGITAAFQNWKGRNIKITIPTLATINRIGASLESFGLNASLLNTTDEEVEEETDESFVTKSEKVAAHQFMIHGEGAVRQCSPTTHAEALIFCDLVMRKINEFLAENGSQPVKIITKAKGTVAV